MKFVNKSDGSILRTSNPHEIEAISRFIGEGYTVYNRGWPDLLLIRGNEVRAVEIKPHNHSRLKPMQKLVAEALEKIGLKVELWSPNK